MPIKIIFLDRDGVINAEVGYLFKIQNFKFIDGVFEACVNFLQLGYKIIIVSNQSGISRGYYTESDYQKLTQWMLTQFNKNGVGILDTFHCPHSIEADCNCRKPKPGMFNEAATRYNIDLEKSWMIGDKETDITAANLAGVSKTILVRSGHKIEEPKSKAMFFLNSIHESENIIKH
ncbi:D-glycero-beta-D-manno-heptose 1,7-bisphosphate 7-phosphatase [Candidatus Pseudothioglobus sp. Uisw_086]|jgi:D-glycero-D-manno-heptose 1,7-bisphosphate phosphatase|uniref:D-glycero-beta-D-manno-heptose 1,7-bisphosphate 7-phosphatase n=1 Tax=Candidatus Pseudothioglobus sp. Uisw_086 TaxID=3230998 RepID=UPI003A8C8528